MRFSIVILAVATLLFSACTQSLNCFSEEIFCAALVTDTLGLNDYGINQDTWAGLERAKSDGLTDQIAIIESVDARDYEKNIAYFANRGYDMIITSGVGLQNETLHLSTIYVDSVFVGINQAGEEIRPNLIPITFAEDQIGFATGALAARLSKTKVVGAACETSGIDAMWRYCEGFRAGAKYINVEIKTLVIYRDEGDSEKLFLDEAWGFETANTLIKRGADVIFAAGGITAQGALRAAVEATIPAIGAERDQRAALGESGSSVVTSIYGNASFEVQNVMRLLRDGDTQGPRLSQIKVVPFDEKFPESFSREMDALLLSLWNGDVKTNVNTQKP